MYIFYPLTDMEHYSLVQVLVNFAFPEFPAHAQPAILCIW